MAAINTRTSILAQAGVQQSTATTATGKFDRDGKPLIPTEFWLNFGYETHIQDPETGEYKTRFIPLKQGIALDTMGLVEAKRGDRLARVQEIEAQNELRDEWLDHCKDLEPGTNKVLPGTIFGLQIQLLRIRAAVVTNAEMPNPFKRERFKLVHQETDSE